MFRIRAPPPSESRPAPFANSLVGWFYEIRRMLIIFSSLPYFASAPAFQLVVRIAERMSGDGFASALPPPVLVHNARLLLVKLLERTRGTPLYATA